MSKNKYFIIAYWAIFTLAIIYFHSSHFFNGDEGVVLEGAWNLVNGKHLYTDFYEIVTPGSFFLVAWIWKIVGVSYWSARLAGMICLFLAGIGLFMSSRLLIKHWPSYLGPLLILISSINWPLINHNIYFLPFAVWSMYFFIKSLVHGSKLQRYALSGLLIGLGTLFLQHKGALIIAAGITTLLILNFRNSSKIIDKKIFTYCLYAFLPISLLFIFWPIDVLYANLITPLSGYIQSQELPVFNFYFTAVALLVTVWMFRKNINPGARFLLIAQAFLLVGAASSPVIPHITMILFPVYILLPEIFLRLGETTLYIKYTLLGLYSIGVAAILLHAGSTALNTFKRPFFIQSGSFKEMTDKYCPGPYIYAGPWVPELYFETRKLNPTPYNMLIDGAQSKEQFRNAVQLINKYKPTCALIFYSLAFRYGYTGNNVLELYLHNAYTPILKYGDVIIENRKPIN